MFTVASMLSGVTMYLGPRSALDKTVLWFGFGCMLFGLVSFGYLRLTKATDESRGFYDKSIIIVLVAAAAYLGMALNLGNVVVGGEAHRVYVSRYADWLITTPLLLLDVILFAKPINGKGWQWDATLIAFFDIIMVVTGIVAALDTPPFRWIWFWFSTGAFVVVGMYVLNLFLKAGRIPESHVSGRLRALTGTLGVLWLIYPFVFALYFGGLLTPGVEDLIFMILDVSAKVAFGFLLLLGPAVELVDTVPNVIAQVRRSRDLGPGRPTANGATPEPAHP